MPSITCYRCNRSLPSRYFEPPITLCLVCYGRSRGNHGLNVNELRAKARRARKGKSLNNEGRASLEKELITDSNIYECPICHIMVEGEPAMNSDCEFDHIKLSCGHEIKFGDDEK